MGYEDKLMAAWNIASAFLENKILKLQ